MKKHPFPFIGAGLANYDEWCEINIKFLRVPVAAQKSKIISLVPGPIRHDRGICSRGVMTFLTPSFIHWHVEKIYGNPKKIKETPGKHNVSKKVMLIFEKKIEQWLLNVHEFCPIEMVYRIEDSKGIAFSPWHTESCESAPALLRKWLSQRKQPFRLEKSLGEFVDTLLIYGKKDDISEEIAQKAIKRYLPDDYVFSLLLDEETNELLSLLKEKGEDIEYIREMMTAAGHYLSDGKINKKNRLFFYELLIIILKHKTLWHDDFNSKEIISKTLTTMLKSNNKEMIQTLKSQIKKTIKHSYAIIRFLNDQTYDHFLKKKRWNLAIVRYEFLLDIVADQENPPMHTAFCNLLYCLQNDISRLGVNVQKNLKWIKTCLKFADKNPPIYFNAATLYVEMDDFHNAFDCFKAYFESKSLEKEALYRNMDHLEKKDLYKGLLKEDMYQAFRKHPGVKNYLKQLNEKLS